MLGTSDSNVTTLFVQIHYFITKHRVRIKDIVSPCQNVGGTCPPSPLKLGPWSLQLNTVEYPFMLPRRSGITSGQQK